jgi:hypothetical protein
MAIAAGTLSLVLTTTVQAVAVQVPLVQIAQAQAFFLLQVELVGNQTSRARTRITRLVAAALAEQLINTQLAVPAVVAMVVASTTTL